MKIFGWYIDLNDSIEEWKMTHKLACGMSIIACLNMC